ncbi:hypothetical protein D8674_034921 [Pyrus ussuriensis x Pyrus communis]|uniref:Uncharacterized protein n=1 Tax=Pyrus ussuriensis x Pyrus communis TaxID=2448454 RepID=A0A5N5GAY6_9ROSA|nr:hypothetical protein D8674_034921 [Pyrus ussuriensis x Pyrus communis]
MAFGPYDMTQYVEFAHAIGVAMWNNCPTAKWCCWKYVPNDVKNAVKDQLLLSCNYTFDDTNEELMKLIEETLKRGYKQWRYDVEQNGGPMEQ